MEVYFLDIGTVVSSEESVNTELDASTLQALEDELKELESIEVTEADFVGSWESYKFLLKDIDDQGYGELLSKDDEAEYILLAQQGIKEYQDELLLRNIRLVVRIAKRYVGFSTTVTLGDLIDEGVIGLMRAVSLFDLSKGYRFSTYAIHWIEQAISRALENSGTIRIPVHMHTAYYKYKRFVKGYLQEHGHKPSEEECIRFCESINTSWDALKSVLLNKETPSLNQIVSNDENDETELGDFIRDETLQGNVERYVSNKALREDLMNVMSQHLQKRDMEILIRRFGLNGRSETLEEIGASMGITRERVRQREKHAKDKLKRYPVLKQWVERG